MKWLQTLAPNSGSNYESPCYEARHSMNGGLKKYSSTCFGTYILTEKNLNVDIKEAEIAALAYYSPGSADGRRKGAFYVNR